MWLTVMVYCPAARSGKLKSPDVDVVTVWLSPVVFCSSLTVASGIAAPVVSATLPAMVPRLVCDKTALGTTRRHMATVRA